MPSLHYLFRMPDHTTDHVTCLGCGCACDDVTVVVRGDRIAEARNACAIGAQWFGDGGVPMRVRVNGRDTELQAALDTAAQILSSADGALVYLAGDISCETQRAAAAIADMLHGVLESLTSSTTAPAILAAQRRGRTTATFGEIRNRADTIVFWGMDPAERYPRFASRYAPEPGGLFVPNGRRGRTVIAVDIGTHRGPADADLRIALPTADELTGLALTRAVILGRVTAASSSEPQDAAPTQAATTLAARLTAGKYVAIVADGEAVDGRDPGRAEGLIALAEALNGPTRCALTTLRAGGNRSGADAVMTWQTGYPMAVDFARGFPRYEPELSVAGRIARREIGAALIVGSLTSVPNAVRQALAGVRCVVIGPRASDSGSSAAVAIDTGVAGIHEGGIAYRADDVPVPLRPVIFGVRGAADTMQTLAAMVGTAARAAASGPYNNGRTA